MKKFGKKPKTLRYKLRKQPWHREEKKLYSDIRIKDCISKDIQKTFLVGNKISSGVYAI